MGQRLILLILTFITLPAYASKTVTQYDLEITTTIFGAGDFLVPCRIENQDQKCKLDTGAPISIFSNLVAANETTLINTVNYISVTGNTVACDFLESKTDFSFSGVNIAQPVYLSCPTPNSNHLIGLNHLMQSSFKFDFANRKFIPNYSSKNNLPIKSYSTDPSGHIFIEIEIYKGQKTKTITAMVDTGAGITVVNKDLVLENPDFFTFINGGSFEGLSDTHSNAIQSTAMLVSALRIDQKNVIIPYVMAIDFTSMIEEVGFQVDMIIGANVLKETNSFTVNPDSKTYRID